MPTTERISTTTEFSVLAPKGGDLQQLIACDYLPPFSHEAMNFIDALSSLMLRGSDFRQHPELVALGFWMRKSNIRKLRDRHVELTSQAVRTPRGIAFHIAPANVDTIFVYSWFLSLLCGNSNIVRLSERTTPQLSILLEAFDALLDQDEFRAVADRTLIIRYPHEDRITEALSSVCDIRIAWGGDSSISTIRKVALPPTSTEVAFANKFSLALVDAGHWAALADQPAELAIQAFYRDAYWFGQMGCSSPRLIVWHGNESLVSEAREDFWRRMEAHVKRAEPDLGLGDYMNKIVASHSMAIESRVKIEKTTTSDIMRIHLADLSAIPDHLHCGAGLFLEARIDTLDNLLPALDRRIQTITYCGFNKTDFKQFCNAFSLRGIDRFVPFGKALNFAPVWDGFDLLQTFTREISIS